MAESAAPAICPACAGAAARVLSATNLGRGGQRKRAFEPRLVTKQQAMKKEERPPPAAHNHTHGRPWMMGH